MLGRSNRTPSLKDVQTFLIEEANTGGASMILSRDRLVIRGVMIHGRRWNVDLEKAPVVRIALEDHSVEKFFGIADYAAEHIRARIWFIENQSQFDLEGLR